jgi:hypothetical protein
LPYQSQKQSAYIHAKAAEGVPWAEKFVRDAHGTHVLKKHAIHNVRKKRRKHAHKH